MTRRLPVVFVLTFGAGLLVGLSRFLAPGLVLTGLVFLLTRRMHPAIGFLLGAHRLTTLGLRWAPWRSGCSPVRRGRPGHR